MEFLVDFGNWLWLAVTDESIAGAIKPRVMFFGFLFTVVAWLIKRTKSTADDELLSALKERFFPE